MLTLMRVATLVEAISLDLIPTSRTLRSECKRTGTKMTDLRLIKASAKLKTGKESSTLLRDLDKVVLLELTWCTGRT